MNIYTIGFTKKSAREFFELLKQHGIKRLLDVRLNNSSQLAAFSKKDDLAFFLREICDAEYLHVPSLAPTKQMLDEFKKEKGEWSIYAPKFLKLIKERKIEETTDKELFAVPTVLLCSEDTAECCHRRLVAEYLRDAWGDVGIVHL